MKVTAVIPAYNEAATIGAVIEVLRQVPLIEEIIVVSDGSEDGTAAVAREHGATVIELEQNRGKGAAMAQGAQQAQGDILLFLDADLEGLTPAHVESLLEPVMQGEAEMTVGVFHRGRSLTDWAQIIAPHLSGQRAILKSLFLSAGTEASRFEVEVMLSATAREKGWRVKKVPLSNMTHIMKEEKRGFTRGMVARLGMYKDIAGFFWRSNRKKRKLFRPIVWLLVLLLGLALLEFDLSHIQMARASAKQLADLALAGGQERILIVAPHPDDEVLAAGGLISQAKSQGDSVRVVFVTNGDGFRRGIEAWKGEIPVDPQDFLAYGEQRQEEAKRALAVLGVGEEDLSFLGYPDGGVGKMWENSWSDQEPYLSPTTRKSHVPYSHALSPGAAYVAPNLIADLVRVISYFHPTLIYTSDTDDSHPDHWATGAFTLAALAACPRSQVPQLPPVYTYLVHSGLWQITPAISKANPLLPPAYFLARGTPWYKLALSNETLERKKQALQEYKTQKKVISGFMANFLRPNEVFSQGVIKTIGNTPSLIIRDFRGDSVAQKIERGGDFRALYLGLNQGDLEVRLDLWGPVGPLVTYRLGVYVWRAGEVRPVARYVLSFSSGKGSGVKWLQKPEDYDGEARISYEDQAIHLRLQHILPESASAADYLMISADSWVSKVPVDRIPWQLLRLKGEN